MGLPSLTYLAVQASSALRRFPLVLLSAALAATFALIEVDAHGESWLRGVMAAQLGIPLFFAIAVASETYGWQRFMRYSVSAAAALGTIAYGFTLSEDLGTVAGTRFAQFNVGVHLLVAFAPFVRPTGTRGFWQYNKALFLRFLLALLYSVVLFAGLSVALLALDKLLGVDIGDKSYVRLLILVAFVFLTWVFVGGVPRDIAGLEQVDEYPRGLELFSQYVLVPLVAVYLAILTIYLLKVVITARWPSGWIGYLVSTVSATGILALLLVHPVATREDRRWVGTFSRWFWIVLLPAIVMLLLALGKRIGQYGITERRYLLLVLAIWLAATALWFVTGRRRSIKWIPVTLCLVALATSFGPWGAYAVSRRSQIGRLETLLARNNLWVEGSLRPTEGEVPLEECRQISAVLRYLVRTHGTESLRPRFPALAAADTTDSKPSGRPTRDTENPVRAMAEVLGFPYIEQWESVGGEAPFHYFAGGQERVIALGDADYLATLASPAPLHARALPDSTWKLFWNPPRIELQSSGSVVAAVSLDSVVVRLEMEGTARLRPDAPAELVRVAAEGSTAAGPARLEVYVTQISGRHTSDAGIAIESFVADCVVTLPPSDPD